MNLGLVFESGDFVLIGVFLTLVLMRITWTVIVVRAIKLRAAKKANAQVKDRILGSKIVGRSHSNCAKHGFAYECDVVGCAQSQ